MAYAGLDLANGIPGLYLFNLFSQRLAKWLGLDRLPHDQCEVRKERHDIVTLSFGRTPEESRTADTLARQQCATGLLGRSRILTYGIQNGNWRAPGLMGPCRIGIEPGRTVAEDIDQRARSRFGVLASYRQFTGPWDNRARRALSLRTRGENADER